MPRRENLTNPWPRRENLPKPWHKRENLTKTQSQAHVGTDFSPRCSTKRVSPRSVSGPAFVTMDDQLQYTSPPTPPPPPTYAMGVWRNLLFRIAWGAINACTLQQQRSTHRGCLVCSGINAVSDLRRLEPTFRAAVGIDRSDFIREPNCGYQRSHVTWGRGPVPGPSTTYSDRLQESRSCWL